MSTKQINNCKLMLLAFLCLIIGQAKGQTLPERPTPPLPCGDGLKYFWNRLGGGFHPPSLLPTPPFSPAAIFTCGKIDVYYEDVNSHLHAGFDDPTPYVNATTGLTMPLGQVRRNTFCSVLSYIQSVFDFSNVSDTAHIRVFVDLSNVPVTHPATYPTTYYAYAGTNFDVTTNGVKKGWMADYVTSPSWHLHDSIPHDWYHCFVHLNFDHIVTDGFVGIDTIFFQYLDDGTQPYNPGNACGKIDLYSVLLHEISHAMGWQSFISFDEANVPYPAVSPHVFSALDWSFRVGNNSLPLSLTKVLSGTPSFPSLDSSNPQFIANSNYWINGKAAPDNHPVYSGGAAKPSFLSHLDDQLFSYTFRERISPGDRAGYTMGPFGLAGVDKRTFTKGEIQSFCDIFGYRYIRGDSNVVIKNHTPFSKKMAQHAITPGNYGYFTETVAADATLTNDSGATATINIASLYGSDLVDADPADAAGIYIDSTTLIGFRGCGNGGNNHGLLSVGPDAKSITYKPRANFYGRVQFGVNITDGKEKGSFRVFTIEVLKGNNVQCAAGENMICNPDFEYGSEIRNYTTYAEDAINNSVLIAGTYENKWQGISFSDSHPYCFHSNISAMVKNSGIAVKKSGTSCSDHSTHEYGCFELNFGNGDLWDNPNAKDGVGKRYQMYKSNSGSYYNLAANVKHCHRYTLSFDLFRHIDAGANNLPLHIAFADHTVDLHATTDLESNFSFDTVYSPFTEHSWVHVTLPTFYYCGTTPSNILYIGNTDSLHFIIDNLSLTEDTTEQPKLIVNITQDTPANCMRKLSTALTNKGCDVLYHWTASGADIVAASEDSSIVWVPAEIAANYIVTADDGCRIAKDTTTVADISPGVINGIKEVCAGSLTDLDNTLANGRWSSSDTSIAAVDSLTGVVTGRSGGTAIISYAYCTHGVSVIVTVHPTPAAITGNTSFCVGATITLANAAGGGTWASSTPGNATVSTTGTVTGVAPGTSTITYYTGPTCWATTIVTVNGPVVLGPVSSSVPLSTCVGSPLSLAYFYYLYPPAAADLGTGSWTSSNPSVASVSGTGTYFATVTGVLPGTATITYTVNHCGISITTIDVSVSPAPAPITGTYIVCPGYNKTIAYGGTGGTWSSDNTAIADFGDPTAGVVTGISTGTTTLTYTYPTGCYVTCVVTVTPVLHTITGAVPVCVGNTATLTETTGAGTWSSGNTAIATISGTGLTTGVSAGTAAISYTFGPGCASVADVTVNPLPAPIAGSNTVCVGTTTLLTDATAGGSWASSAPSVATISAGGSVTAIAAGTTTISYSMGTGCYTTAAVTVTAMPAPITGATTVCAGGTVNLANSSAGGTWTSGATTIATVNATTGSVYGVAAGTAMISYTLSGGCYATAVITVNSGVSAITGNAVLCIGGTTTLSDATPGGTWSSGTPAVATISAGALVTAITAGITNITYTIGSTGCFATKQVTVNAVPGPISGITAICRMETEILSCLPSGGTWSSGNPAIVTINASTGLEEGIVPGTAVISYKLAAPGCVTTVIVTVNPVADITGAGSICNGSTTTLFNAVPGGTWSSASTSVATIGLSSGIVTGMSTGMAVMSYILPTGCFSAFMVNVLAAPAAISGPASVCNGSTATLTNATTGGTWSSSATAVATISTGGIVTGLTSGTTTISYKISSGCFKTMLLTVNPLPAAISGYHTVCLGGPVPLSSTTPGGTWSSSNPAVAIVGSATGMVTGITAGTVMVSYILPTGCKATYSVNVLPALSPITGTPSVCQGSTATLSNTASGGSWGSLAPGTATIGALSGIVTGVAPGTATILYGLPSGCYTMRDVTVNALPAAIPTIPALCPGNTATMSCATPGGAWSTSAMPVFTVSPAGLVTAVTPGIGVVTYTLPTGCAATSSVTVLSPAPPVLGSGMLLLCIGHPATQYAITPGGVWTSTNPSVATIDPVSGYTMPLSTGTTNFVYTVPGSCGPSSVSSTATVNPAPTPITSQFNSICHTYTITLTDGVAGGIWYTDDPSTATVNNVTGAVTMTSASLPTGSAAGTVAITYMTGYGCMVTTTLNAYPNSSYFPCSPCNENNFATTPFNTVTSTSITSPVVGPGNFYLTTSATISGNVLAKDAVMYINPGVSLTVDQDAVFTSQGSHFYSCEGLWKGITLSTGPAGSPSPHTARLKLQESLTTGKSTLIEDADIAVRLSSPGVPNVPGQYFIDCRNTIFNKNMYGIYMENCTRETSTLPATPDQYELKIYNTVFTARDLHITGYPVAWPGNYGTGGLKNDIVPLSPYQSPYNITAYPYSLCKNGLQAIEGMHLSNVGANTGSGFLYPGLLIGLPPASPTSNKEWNLFDGLAFGIKGINTNMTVQNNVFQNTRPLDVPPGPVMQTGIYTEATDAHRHNLSVIQVATDTLIARNKFYDCKVGVYSKDYNLLDCSGNIMRGKQNLATDGYTRYGYMIQSQSFQSMKVNNNDIKNIANGISIVSTPGLPLFYLVKEGKVTFSDPVGGIVGNIDVNNNDIAAALPGIIVTPSSSEYLSFGICVQNTLTGTSTTIPLTGTWASTVFSSSAITGALHTTNNHIYDAYRGIMVQGYMDWPITTSDNAISVRAHGTGEKCWGINHTATWKDMIRGNTVNGAGNNNEMTKDDVRAFYCEGTTTTSLRCNASAGTGKGFEFFSYNSSAIWRGNTMSRHQKAMVLNNGYTGPQGDFGTPYDNRWLGTSFWNSTANRNQTFVEGTPPASWSPLYVRSGSATFPTENSALFAPNKYTSSGPVISLFTASGPLDSECPMQEIGPSFAKANWHGFEPHVVGTVSYDVYPDERVWMAQLSTWEAVLRDPMLTDSSALLHEFRALAEGSRLDYLARLEQLLAIGDTAGAAAQLAVTPPRRDTTDALTGVTVKDDASVDYLVDTYKDFYRIFLHYKQHTLSAADSANIPYIANLCPLVYGPVVYKSRALYTAVFNDLQVWCEGCGNLQQRRAAKAEPGNDGQQYSVYPNPNNGDMTLVQELTDNGTVQVQVTDMLGRTVSNTQLHFTEKTSKLNLHEVTPGMYTMKIVDQKGRNFMFKFIINQ